MLCACECLLWDETTQRLMAMGLNRLEHGGSTLSFNVPVDLIYNAGDGTGAVYAQEAVVPSTQTGFLMEPGAAIDEEQWKTLNITRTAFTKTTNDKPSTEVGHA
jgi:hypothetical protein